MTYVTNIMRSMSPAAIVYTRFQGAGYFIQQNQAHCMRVTSVISSFSPQTTFPKLKAQISTSASLLSNQITANSIGPDLAALTNVSQSVKVRSLATVRSFATKAAATKGSVTAVEKPKRVRSPKKVKEVAAPKKLKSKEKPIKTKSVEKSKNNTFSRYIYRVSPELAGILGRSTSTRPAALADIWQYIRDNKLNGEPVKKPPPVEGFRPDEKLLKVFPGTSMINSRIIMKEMSKHFLEKVDEKPKVEVPKAAGTGEAAPQKM